MKIKSIEAFPIDAKPRPATPSRAPIDPAARSFAAMAKHYPELSKSPGGPESQRFDYEVGCLITAEDGTQGFGMGIYPSTSCPLITDHFAPSLIGQNCMATEKVYDMMMHMALPYGRIGLASYAISAVDIAMWDLKGKLLSMPVYELLGGPQRDDIFCYGSCTMVDHGFEEQLRWVMELGFKATKVFLTYGPQHGMEGFKKNVEMVAKAREIVGDDVELAVDMWLGMNVEYAVRLIEELRPYKLKWFEDPFRPEDVTSYRQLRQRVPWQTLATGLFAVKKCRVMRTKSSS